VPENVCSHLSAKLSDFVDSQTEPALKEVGHIVLKSNV
jgi:hypothetical protein